MNTQEMLDTDFSVVENFTPMSESDRQGLFRTAPELGDYVCRLCNKCNVDGFDPQTVFLLEGLYDRQMDSGRVNDTAQFALQERLKFWFQQNITARNEYGALKIKVDPEKSYTHLNKLCPYKIDIDRKLKLAHEKLSTDGYLYL
jgi:hypothetical protein